MLNESNIEKLKKLLAILDPSLSREELEKALEGALFLLLKIQSENGTEIGQIRGLVEQVKKLEGPKGERGDRGEQGESGPQGEMGLQGERGIEGKQGVKGERGENGKDGKDGKDGIAGKDGKDGSPDTSVQIRNKLESLNGEDRLDVSAIRGLKEMIKAIPERPTTTIFGPGKTRIILVDLSDKLDSATKTFFLGTHYGIISVNSSSMPFGAFREGIDYEAVGKNIVFSAGVDATVSLAAGQSLIVKMLR